MNSRLIEEIATGFKTLWLHKLRSLLTILGIVFGVGSVVAMLAIGEGASQQTLEQIKRLGSSNIMIRSIKSEDENQGNRVRFPIYGLTYEDALRIEFGFEGIKNVVSMKTLEKEARLGRNRINLRIVGTTTNWFDVVTRPLLAGRILSREDSLERKNVCVLTRYGANKLLANEATIGQQVYLGSNVFEVVGILNTEDQLAGSSSMQSPDQPIDAYIPLTTARAVFGDIAVVNTSNSRDRSLVELHQIIVQLENSDLVLSGAKSILRTLKMFHSTKDYEMDVPLELLKQTEKTKRTFNTVLGSIAGISLIVGGIGIMNIMLASVTERTKEIGIRRAIGATRKMIIRQFLIEAVILTISGGLIGIGFGVVVPSVVEYFAKMPTKIPLYSIVLSLGISVFIGVIFGLYPAWKAAQLDPIESLRHQ